MKAKYYMDYTIKPACEPELGWLSKHHAHCQLSGLYYKNGCHGIYKQRWQC